MSQVTAIKYVCAENDCQAHISGPKDAPASSISHGICPACLKAKHPGAWKFGRRRALMERLALGLEETMAGMNELVFKAETPL